MHTHGQVVSFLEKAFGDTKLTNVGLNANVLCPVCNEHSGETEKKKLAIRTDNWVNHCWSCNYKSKTIYGLLRRYKPWLLEEFLVDFQGAALITDSQEDLLDTKLTLPVGFELLAEFFYQSEAPWYIRQAKNYLLSRGLTYRDFWYWKFGVTNQDKNYINRVLVPSFDADGELNLFVARACKPHIKQRYLNPKFNRDSVVFNELNIDWNEELTLVEGPFDLVKCNDNATCLMGKELTETCRLFQQIVSNKTPVILALDSTALNSAMKIGRLLLNYDITVKLITFPNGIKDPGELTKTQFQELLSCAKVIGVDDYLLYRVKTL